MQQTLNQFKKLWLPAIATVLVAVLISTFPHIVNFFEVGEPVYFADNDDSFLYLQYGSHAYHNNPLKLQDPIAPTPTGTFAPWTQILPGVIVAKTLGLPPIYITLVWRIIGAITIGLSLFALLFYFIRGPWTAAILSMVMMTDSGVRTAQVFFKQIKIFILLLMGKADGQFGIIPDVHLHWRIITPSLSLFTLLLFFLAFTHAQKKDSFKPTIVAGLLLGLLFHFYFYYWTTTLLAIGIMFLFERNRIKHYLLLGLIGALTGLPAVLMQRQTQNNATDQWLFRNGFFVPVENVSNFLFPKFAVMVLILTAIYVFRNKRRDLYFIWCFCLSAILLLNQQVISGLTVQNSHFLYPGGPSLYLLALLILFSVWKINFQLRFRKPLILMASLFILIGFVLRYEETKKCSGSRQLLRDYLIYRSEKPGLQSISLKPNAVIAGEVGLGNFLVIERNLRTFDGLTMEMSSAISVDEWNERTAVNALLNGQSRSNFEAEQNKVAFNFGWVEDPTFRKKIFEKRLSSFDYYLANPAEIFNRFTINYVLTKSQHEVPKLISSYPNDWKELYRGPELTLWERN